MNEDKNKYFEYLETIGFRECITNEFKELTKGYSDINEATYNYLWHIYEGSLDIDELIIESPLIITGNLTTDQKYLATEYHSGLVVLGKTKLNSMDLGGETHFIGGVKFKTALVSTGNGPERSIRNPEGPFLYIDSDSTIIESIDKELIGYCFEESSWTEFGDYREILNPKYCGTGDKLSETEYMKIYNDENYFLYDDAFSEEQFPIIELIKRDLEKGINILKKT